MVQISDTNHSSSHVDNHFVADRQDRYRHIISVLLSVADEQIRLYQERHQLMFGGEYLNISRNRR